MPQLKRHASEQENEGKRPRSEESFGVGHVIQACEDTYLVTELLGRGSYGRVFRCWDGGEQVAMKCTTIASNNFELREVEFLQKIQPFSKEFHLLKLYHAFPLPDPVQWNLCIVTENLDCSLAHYLRETGNDSLPLPGIRAILTQLLQAVGKLKDLEIIHADIKPENIMMVDRVNKPYCIKLIDFGCAATFKEYRGKVISYKLQTRLYRAPENILGLPCTEAIDIWSVGCVAAECLNKFPLYPGDTEFHMLEIMVQVQGMFPDSMLDIGTKVDNFFVKESESWRLKTPHEVGLETQDKFPFDDLSNFIECMTYVSGDDEEVEDSKQLIFLMKQLLQLKAENRATAVQALQLPFIALSDFTGQSSKYYRESLKTLNDTVKRPRRVLADRQVNLE